MVSQDCLVVVCVNLHALLFLSKKEFSMGHSTQQCTSIPWKRMFETCNAGYSVCPLVLEGRASGASPPLIESLPAISSPTGVNKTFHMEEESQSRSHEANSSEIHPTDSQPHVKVGPHGKLLKIASDLLLFCLRIARQRRNLT